MSERLSRIKNTCPIYDKIKSEVTELLSYIEDDNEYKLNIESCCEWILDYADEIRNIAGDLRDTASDIASSKNTEIEALEREKEDLKETISDLEYELIEVRNVL